jgi:flagellin
MLSSAEGNLDVVLDNVSRIRDLTLQAKNGTYSYEEIVSMQDEVAERIGEIDRINASASHSSLRLFGDCTDETKPNDTAQGLAKSGATFQVGSNDGVDNTIKASEDLFKAVNFTSLTGAKNFNLVSISEEVGGKAITAKEGKVTYEAPTSAPDGTAAAAAPEGDEVAFDQAIRALDLAIDNITHRKSIIGSAGNRMDSALNSLTTQYENLSSAKSIITDADIAEQASKYTQDSILQQVSTSLLAQANQAPSVALSLI